MKKFLGLASGLLAATAALSTAAFAVTTTTRVSSPAADAFAGLFFAIYCGCYLLACIVVLGFFVFDIMMLIDVSNRTEAELPSKTVYVVLLVVGLFMPLIGIVTSLVYYFSIKKRRG